MIWLPHRLRLTNFHCTSLSPFPSSLPHLPPPSFIFTSFTTGMYFIYSGKVKILIKQFREAEDGTGEIETNQVLVTIAAGCYFGEVPLLVNHQEKRSATAQAAEVCNLYALSGPDLKELIKDYPQTKAYMTTVAAKRLCRATNFKFKDGGPEAHRLRAPPLLDDMKVDEEDLKTDFFKDRLARHGERKRENAAGV